MANPSADLAHRPDSIEEAQGGEELTSRGLPDSESEFLLRVARGSEGAEPPRGLSGAEDVTWAEPRFELRRRLGAGRVE